MNIYTVKITGNKKNMSTIGKFSQVDNWLRGKGINLQGYQIRHGGEYYGLGFKIKIAVNKV